MFQMNFSIEGNKKGSIKLEKYEKRMIPNLLRGIDKATLRLEAHIKERKLSGQVLNVRTNRLRSSITVVKAKQGAGGSIWGAVGTNVKYARIHEYGGEIKAKNAPYLKFPIGGRWASVKSVTIPARPYMEPTLREKQADIERDIIKSITKPLN